MKVALTGTGGDEACRYQHFKFISQYANKKISSFRQKLNRLRPNRLLKIRIRWLN